MLVTCWSTKGGSGTTVVAASLALLIGRTSPNGCLFVDLGGDGPAVFGVPEPGGPALDRWLADPHATASQLLERAVPVANSGVDLVATGAPSLANGHALAAAVAQLDRPVVVDAGSIDHGPGYALAGAADLSILVVRPCYLAVRRAVSSSLQPHGVVLVTEPGRALRRRDIESLLGVPMLAEVPIEAAIARSVDAGLLAARLPSDLLKPLGRIADRVQASQVQAAQVPSEASAS